MTNDWMVDQKCHGDWTEEVEQNQEKQEQNMKKKTITMSKTIAIKSI